MAPHSLVLEVQKTIEVMPHHLKVLFVKAYVLNPSIPFILLHNYSLLCADLVYKNLH